MVSAQTRSESKRILLTGGSGLLGKELQKYITCYAPTRKEFDFCKDPVPEAFFIIHCGAYTDVARAEEEKKLCYEANVVGTRRLAETGIPMMYISTEYVFDGEQGGYKESDIPNPRNFYALSKLLGEFEARRTRSVVVRTLFKPRPFEHAGACVDQYTTGDYVDIMAKEIAKAIELWAYLPETIHIGTERKSTYELARQSRPDVIPITINSIGVRIPKDTSLDTSLWKKIKEKA
jgi:dTDP-4-dehydrorhamnose reductase